MGTPVLAVTAILSMVILLNASRQRKENSNRQKTTYDKNNADARLQKRTLLLLGAALWPLAFDRIVGLRRLASTPLLTTSLIAPLALLLLSFDNTRGGHGVQRATDANSSRRSEAHTLIYATLTAGALLFNATPGTLRQEGVRVLMIALVLCTAIVIPSPADRDDSNHSMQIRVLQQIAMYIAVGLFVGGIIMASPIHK